MNRISSGLLFATLVLPSSALAFTEDICFQVGGGVTDCTPLPPACLPVGTANASCRTAAVLAYGQSAVAGYAGARSTLHTDVVFLTAQFVGYSFEDAYWMAAYDEVTDLGSFEPLNVSNGLPATMPDGSSARTASMSGLERGDFESGGIFFHFESPRNPDAAAPVGKNGMVPAASDAVHEVLLAHVRAWAMPGSTAPLCAAGLTAASGAGDNATGSSCYPSATVHGVTTVVDGPNAGSADAGKTWDTPTGPQRIVDEADAAPVDSTHFAELVGGSAARQAAARAGVYFHAYGDRTSHHVCLDRGFLYGPTGSSWSAETTDGECAQGYHLLRHIWETGVDYSKLRPEDRTTPAYLDNLYGELLAFRGAPADRALAAGAREELVGRLIAAESTEGAQARLAALHAITCEYGLSPFPGTAACPAAPADASSASATDAGAPSSASSVATSSTVAAAAAEDEGGCDTTAGGAGALQAAATGAALLLGLAVRRRQNKV